MTGTKIFISGGEHDMAGNIVHMVIAKIPDADGKLRDDLGQVNFFLVPKFLVSEDGKMGARNGVFCGGIEHKMGIKGSATCTMNFDDALAFRLGPKPDAAAAAKGEHQRSAGMAGMFSMMNGARLGVGVMGIALAEVAAQNGAAYARERLTGRALTGAKEPGKPADPIIVHPDVRRMLLHARSFTEGARAMAIWVSLQFAIARSSRSEAEREEASLLADLVTPIVKAFFTDVSFEAVNAAMQCFGGHGYIREHGMEQFVRDARINQVYEGANGIQALDLVARKLGRKGGKAPFALFAKIKDFAAKAPADSFYAKPLGESIARLEAATLWLAEHGLKNPGRRRRRLRRLSAHVRDRPCRLVLDAHRRARARRAREQHRRQSLLRTQARPRALLDGTHAPRNRVAPRTHQSRKRRPYDPRRHRVLGRRRSRRQSPPLNWVTAQLEWRHGATDQRPADV